MYAWIWRHLPFGLPGKLAGSVLLASAVVALLWYVVFPWAEPLLPFDDVQVTQDSGVPAAPAGGSDSGGAFDTSPSAPTDPSDEHDLPYNTESNNPVPSATAGR